MKTKTVIILAILAMVAIIVMPLLLIDNSEFAGADGAAGDLALEIREDYNVWAQPLWSPPGGETESLLFALQAALGSGVFCFCLGYLLGKKKAAPIAQENKE